MRKSKSILIIATLIMALSYSFSSAEVLNPNYGTTTYFSNKDEMPSSDPPIYDTGKRKSDDKNKKGDNPSNPGGSLFGQIIGGVDSFFNGLTTSDDSTKTSLFDLQKNSDQNSSGNYSGEFIMGAKGESLENMNADEITAYNNKFAKINFNSDGSPVAPKRSKLIFTNIIIPVDMTTQYVLIALVFLAAVGGVVGYYFWKKDAENEKDNKEEKSYYD